MFEEDGIQVWVPPGWPAVVRPPGSEGWVATAVEFLFDCCPADYRAYPLLRSQPVVLANLARGFVRSQLEGTRVNLSTVRPALAGQVGTSTVDGAVDVLHREGARLVRVQRAVELVEQALNDVRFTPKL